jgi:hypothetical protein
MSDRADSSGDEPFREQRIRIGRYDRGLRDDKSSDSVAAREEHRERLAYDDNAATAPGEFCELCGSVIAAGQPSRLRADGWWIHEACPIRPE